MVFEAVEQLEKHRYALNGCVPIALELERLANHTGDLGALANDVAFLPTSSACGKIRGDFLNLTALLTGNRFGRNFLRPGGCRYDLEPSRLSILFQKLQAALVMWTKQPDGCGTQTLCAHGSRERARSSRRRPRRWVWWASQREPPAWFAMFGSTIPRGGIVSRKFRWPCGRAATFSRARGALAGNSAFGKFLEEQLARRPRGNSR